MNEKQGTHFLVSVTSVLNKHDARHNRSTTLLLTPPVRVFHHPTLSFFLSLLFQVKAVAGRKGKGMGQL